MKLTNKQLRQIIKEELEHVLQEGQRYNGVIEILTGDKESTVYSIEGASGSMGGRQSLTIAAERFYNSSYPEDAENTARQWVDFLNRKHGLDLEEKAFADSLRRNSIRVFLRRINDDGGSGGFRSSMPSFYGRE